MASKRKFYRTVYTIEILSEGPVPGDLDLEEIMGEVADGTYSARSSSRAVEIDAVTCARDLVAHGRKPGQFGLDADGNDTDE
jgi:hypothetical protein